MNTWGEAMKEIGAMREDVGSLKIRVANLESSGIARFSRTMDGRVVVDANEWDRLQRIETAARQTIVLLDETDLSRGLYHRLVDAVRS